MLADAFSNQNPNNNGKNNNPKPPSAGLKSANANIFNLDAKDPSHLGMVSDGKLRVYTDVYAFKDRLLDLAASRGDDIVRDVWTQCV